MTLHFIIDDISFDTRHYYTGVEDFQKKAELDEEYRGQALSIEDPDIDIGHVFNYLFKWFENTDWLIHKAVLTPYEIPHKFKSMFATTQTDCEEWDSSYLPKGWVLESDVVKDIKRRQFIEIRPLKEVRNNA